MKYFDLDTLNLRKQTFQYGPTEIDNMSGGIESKHLSKNALKMCAREMTTFVLHLPLMVGDFVPFDDPVWTFLINFIEIIDILRCYEVTESWIAILESKTKEHNRDYVLLFNDTLKPKFHNLIHYPNIIICFKYEFKHRQFKVYSHCITSRKNICLTLAKKYELKFAYQLINPGKFSAISINLKDKIESSYSTMICQKLNVQKGMLESYSHLSYRGTEYRCGNFISIYKNNIEYSS